MDNMMTKAKECQYSGGPTTGEETEESQAPHSSSSHEVTNDEHSADASIKTTEGCSIGLKYVEPAMFFAVLSGSIVGVVTTNVIEMQYCKAVLNIHNPSYCLNTTAPHFANMQKYASSFSMYQMIAVAVFPAIASIFLGPWSDTFGRRPLMLSGSLGYIISFFLWSWGSSTSMHPIYFLIFDLPMALSGAPVVIQLAAFCYVCDVTTTDVRAFRMGIMIGLVYLASFVGTLSGPYLQDISYTFTLAVGTFASSFTFLYVLIFLKESVATTETQRRLMNANPFQWSYMVSIYETCYVKQSSHTVKILVYVGFLAFINAVQVLGEGTVFYLFLQNALDWTVKDYTHLASICVLVPALAASVLTSKSLGLADLEIANIVTGIRMVSMLLFFFGERKWLIYVTASLSSIAGILMTVLRSFLSKIIHSDDIGKVLALCGMIEALAPLVGSPVYNMVYSSTLETYPKMIFLVSAIFCLVMALLTARIVNLVLRPTNSLPLDVATLSPSVSR